MDDVLTIVANVLTLIALAGGIFFMTVGAVGVLRLPDFYSRTHAASKPVTLGVLGLLAALVLFVGNATQGPPRTRAEAGAAAEVQREVGESAGEPTTAAVTKGLLVLAFFFIAAPVGSHMLARAAHRAGVRPWHGTLGDDLADDTGERTR